MFSIKKQMRYSGTNVISFVSKIYVSTVHVLLFNFQRSGSVLICRSDVHTSRKSEMHRCSERIYFNSWLCQIIISHQKASGGKNNIKTYSET
jgi:hypothetical protein